jgi:hypothetical protein
LALLTNSTMQVYAVVVGALSAVTCVAYFLPFVLRLASGIVMAAWDFILFVLWITLFGIFAKVRPTSPVVHLQWVECRWWELTLAETYRCTSTRTPRATPALRA